jgi:hypothetical protein
VQTSIQEGSNTNKAVFVNAQPVHAPNPLTKNTSFLIKDQNFNNQMHHIQNEGDMEVKEVSIEHDGGRKSEEEGDLPSKSETPAENMMQEQ